MTHANPSPEDKNSPQPGSTPGLEGGGSVSPGDTPPTAGTMSGTAPDAHKAPNMGPVSGNRTPMVITLVLLGLVVLASAGFIVASLLASD